MSVDPTHDHSQVSAASSRSAGSLFNSNTPSLMRTAVIAMLVLYGVCLWLVVMHGIAFRQNQLTLVGISAALAMIRPIARGGTRLLDGVSNPSPRRRLIVTVAVFIGGAAYLYSQAVIQHRDFAPRYHDEYSYLIQARMIAHGRLWMPAHPLADFFETFQLIASPKYASVYFPGAAILFAPGIWFVWPPWVIPLLAAAGVLALIYRIFAEMVDGLAGLLSAFLVAHISIFREQSLMAMSQVPALLAALVLILIWLKWRSAQRLKWAFMAGIVSGWLAITRPVDALIVLIPFLTGVALNLRKHPFHHKTATVLIGALGAIPFLVVQLIFNHAITGRFMDTPFDFYMRQVYPQCGYGFARYDSSLHTGWPQPQVHKASDAMRQAFLPIHTPGQTLVKWGTIFIPAAINRAMAHPLLIVLLPVGLLGLAGRRWVIASMLPLFVLLYIPYPFFLTHYIVLILPSIILLVVLGLHTVASASALLRPQILTFLVVGVLTLTISQSAPFNRMAIDEKINGEPLRTIDTQLATLSHRPAIVLFNFSPTEPLDLEAVYNVDVVWPDDAPVIRAHDQAARNVELFNYFAQRQPDRWVYLYDRVAHDLKSLGPVSRLARSQ